MILKKGSLVFRSYWRCRYKRSKQRIRIQTYFWRSFYCDGP